MENRFKGTPAPWEINYDNNDYGQWLTVGPAKIFFGWNKTPPDNDALLIKAALPMLEAIVNFLEWRPMTNSDRYLCEQKMKNAIEGLGIQLNIPE